MVISGVVAVGATLTSSITGIPGYDVEGVTLADIRIVLRGGDQYCDTLKDIPEQVPAYPTPRMFGVFPAYGLYCRHARDVTLRNVQLSYTDDFFRITTQNRKEVKWQASGVPYPVRAGKSWSSYGVRPSRRARRRWT